MTTGRHLEGCARQRLAAILCALSALLLPPTNASRALVTNDRDALLPVVSNQDDAGEYWDVTARFESGHWFFARFLVTNLGPGSRTAVGVAQVVFPDGKVSELKRGKRDGDWSISADRTRLKVGAPVLDFGKSPCQVEVETRKHKTAIFLDFSPDAIGVWNPEPGHRMAVVLPVPVTGTLLIPPLSEPLAVRGWLTLTHVVQERAEDELVLRRWEIATRTTDGRYYATEVLSPSGKRRRWLVDQRQGRSTEESAFEVQESFAARIPVPEYPVPKFIRIGSDELTVRSEILRWNPLEILPQPFRWILSRRAQPQRVWASGRWASVGAATAPARESSPSVEAVLAVMFVQAQPIGSGAAR